MGSMAFNRLNRSYGGVAGSSGAGGGGWAGGRSDMFLARIAQLLESAPHQTGQVITGVLNGQAGTSMRQSYYSTR
jgi:hypothetical protein